MSILCKILVCDLRNNKTKIIFINYSNATLKNFDGRQNFDALYYQHLISCYELEDNQNSECKLCGSKHVWSNALYKGGKKITTCTIAHYVCGNPNCFKNKLEINNLKKISALIE
jgi:hypothetical protein